MLQVSDLHHKANRKLSAVSGNPKKLVLIHTAIALGSSLLLTVITYLTDLLIADTGGLGGLGIRSILTTLQSVLQLAVSVILPFWQMGIFYAALQWANGEEAGFGSLLQGLRRIRSVLGLLFLRGGLLLMVGFAIFNVSYMVFIMTPFSTPLLEVFTPIMEQGATPEQMEALLTPEVTAAAFQAAIPLIIVFVVLYGAVAILLFYRIRFANFAVMEGLPAGRALLKSFMITRKNCLQVLKVDLSFWWFYLLQALSVALCYGDTLLPALGVSLPVSPVVAAFVFYVLGSLCQGILLWQWEAKRVTLYGLTYRTLDGTIDSNIVDIEP